MTKLVESTGMIYKSGLTKTEEAIINARTAPLIRNLTAQEFKMSMIKPITISGIKQLPSQEEFSILSDLIKDKYGFMTIAELQLAFDLNALGTEWIRVEHFNMFSVQYVSDVLKSFIDYGRKTQQDIKKKEVRKELPMSERVNIQALHDMIESDKQDENYHRKIRYTGPMLMNSLLKRGYFKDHYLSDEWYKKTKSDIKQKTFALMGEWDRSKYSKDEWKKLIDTEQINQIKCAAYSEIISNNEIYEKVMNEIKADL